MRVDPLYERLAPLYDAIYGRLLQPGRRTAMARLAPRGSERILEVGVGTGIDLHEYPADCRVVAIDLSGPMIARAKRRLTKHRRPHVALCRMDAGRLAFPDASFDAVYAPYLINVVPDPVRVGIEIQRVCRPGGRIVLVNHFDRIEETDNVVNRLVGPVATAVSRANWHLDFGEFLRATGLTPQSVEAVNVPRVSTVVVCRRL